MLYQSGAWVWLCYNSKILVVKHRIEELDFIPFHFNEVCSLCTIKLFEHLPHPLKFKILDWICLGYKLRD